MSVARRGAWTLAAPVGAWCVVCGWWGGAPSRVPAQITTSPWWGGRPARSPLCCVPLNGPAVPSLEDEKAACQYARLRVGGVGLAGVAFALGARCVYSGWWFDESGKRRAGVLRSGAGAALGGLLLLLLVLGLVPAVALADCPNAGVRGAQGFSGLPDCRALELVSPQLKNGADVAGSPTRTRVAADGECGAVHDADGVRGRAWDELRERVHGAAHRGSGDEWVGHARDHAGQPRPRHADRECRGLARAALHERVLTGSQRWHVPLQQRLHAQRSECRGDPERLPAHRSAQRWCWQLCSC